MKPLTTTPIDQKWIEIVRDKISDGQAINLIDFDLIDHERRKFLAVLKAIAPLIEMIRIEATRRHQAFEYGAENHKPTIELAVEATNHLRKILALAEKAQSYV